MSYANLVNIDPTSLLLKGDEVKRSFEKDWLLRLFAKHKDLPQSDVIQFLHKAQLTGANPILDQIYLIERNVKVKEYGQPERWEKRGTIVYSYQFLNAKANETGERGSIDKGTEVRDLYNPFSGETKKELIAWATVKRRGETYKHEVKWTSFFQDNAQWRKDPYGMLEKCAVAGVLRLAFPEALSGVYIDDEMREEDLEAEIERRSKFEAIETTADKVLERKEELEKKLASTEDVTKIEALLEVIKDDMSALTLGCTIAEKGKAMTENLGVNKFDLLKSNSLEELELKSKKLKDILQEKIDREIKKTESSMTTETKKKGSKQEPHTFNIGGT